MFRKLTREIIVNFDNIISTVICNHVVILLLLQFDNGKAGTEL